MRVDANEPRSLWVIGHRVTLLPVGGRIAAVEVVTPAGVPGPPPHHHEDADESFYVTSGRLGVMWGDTWTSLGPGEYTNVPRGTVHSFRNEGTEDVKVITGFEPQGFERFFLEYGVDVDEAGCVRDLRQRSDDRPCDRRLRPVRHDPGTDVAHSAQTLASTGRSESRKMLLCRPFAVMPAAHSPVAYAPTVDIEFVASVAVIAADPALSRELYVDALGLPLKASEGDDYIHSENVAGVKHFGVWPLAQVAQACFGTGEWPQDRPVPQASIEFEVADAAAVQAAAAELEAQGFQLLHHAREEPWGQTVARLQSVEGLIIGLSYAPWLHEGA